ncbi:MAG: hypothetical protein IIC39_01605 [Candidatus Marinimicrobia bacterium]|nr:hypothetical protein [Candidatus Neomarinimicrobiota bacterium]
MGRAALIFVLGFIVIFGMVRNNINKTSETASTNSSEFTEKVIARNIANSAIEYGISVFSETGNDSDYSNSDFLGGSYSADFIDLGDTLRLLVTSTYEGIIHTSRVDMTWHISYFPDATGGASVGGGSGLMVFDLGGNVSITGNDTNFDGTDGPGPDLAAFTLSSDTDSASLAADSSFLTGDPPIEVSSDTTSKSVSELVAFYSTIADTTLSPGAYNGVTFGSEANPMIVYSNGHLSLGSGTSGYGILAVDGSLHMGGSSAWYGMVLINSSDSLDAFSASGNPAIYGAFSLGTSDTTTTMKMTGTVDIYYSTQGIATALAAFNDAVDGVGGGYGSERTLDAKIYYE